LLAARKIEDARLIALVGRLDEAALAGELAYRNMADEEQRRPLLQVLGHIVNHQTHHRGQIHCLLSGTPVPPPPLDLIYLDWDR
jgi:uncharacterized damage-inducible protein DinB